MKYILLEPAEGNISQTTLFGLGADAGRIIDEAKAECKLYNNQIRGRCQGARRVEVTHDQKKKTIFN